MKILVQITGPQGSGKSTLAKEFAGMLERYDIKVSHREGNAGVTLGELTEARPDLEVVFETSNDTVDPFRAQLVDP